MSLILSLIACVDDTTKNLEHVRIERTETVLTSVSTQDVTDFYALPNEKGCVVDTVNTSTIVFENGDTESTTSVSSDAPQTDDDVFTTSGTSFFYDGVAFTVPGCLYQDILGVRSVNSNQAVFNVAEPGWGQQGLYTFFGYPEKNAWWCDQISVTDSIAEFAVQSWDEQKYCLLNTTRDPSEEVSVSFYEAKE